MLATIATTEVADLPRGHQTADRLDRLRRAGWSLLPSGFKTTMRTNWTEWHAVREYVQNALDETGAVEVALDQLGGEPVTFIRDAGRGFYAASLRVGQQKGLDTESTEEARARALREQLCLRGRFGEGMKLATLPVLRSGGAILIRTKGMDATFCIGDLVILPGSPPAVELFLAVRANAVTQGTAVALVGVDHTRLKISATEEPRLVDRVVPLLVARDPGTVVATVRGVQPSIGERETSALPASAQACRTRQLLGTKPGRIFVRDIFVEDSKLNWAYSWNFWFDDAVAALGSDRDRFQLDATDIQLGREILDRKSVV